MHNLMPDTWEPHSLEHFQQLGCRVQDVHSGLLVHCGFRVKLGCKVWASGRFTVSLSPCGLCWVYGSGFRVKAAKVSGLPFSPPVVHWWA